MFLRYAGWLSTDCTALHPEISHGLKTDLF
jgi:hypothetical protein